MILCGLKITLADYKKRLRACPDFFEIIYQANYSLNKYEEMARAINQLKRPFFFHLSTTFFDNQDVYLLNPASPMKFIAEKSTSILQDEIKKLTKFNPRGFIVHAPTKFDFSQNKKIIGRKINKKYLLASLKLLKKLSPKIYIENTPEAILIDKQKYFLEPLENSIAKEYGLNALLDTGHFFTTCLKLNKKFEILEIANRFTYFHISTQIEKTINDQHGKVFTALKREFPSEQEMEKLIGQIKKSRNKKNYYMVCEPCGNTKVHLENLNTLRRLIKG